MALSCEEVTMKKADVLEFAILGVLQETPVHGYELRKRLAATLGTSVARHQWLHRGRGS
jgi:DNA-binding PadR family transcriptional regulator